MVILLNVNDEARHYCSVVDHVLLKFYLASLAGFECSEREGDFLHGGIAKNDSSCVGPLIPALKDMLVNGFVADRGEAVKLVISTKTQVRVQARRASVLLNCRVELIFPYERPLHIVTMGVDSTRGLS